MSTDTLRDEHKDLRKAVWSNRKKAAAEDRPMTLLIRETFRIWDVMKANGESKADRIAYLATMLQQILIHGREWKYLCQQCDDYGLVISECDGSPCGVSQRRHLPHSYGTACVCGKGRRFDPPAKDTYPEDFRSAGKTRKPSKPSGFGR